jgi:hypothetical protein
MSGRTILQLIYRLNEINIMQDKLEIKSMELEKERMEIIKELCGHIPNLENDENINPKKRVRKNE